MNDEKPNSFERRAFLAAGTALAGAIPLAAPLPGKALAANPAGSARTVGEFMKSGWRQFEIAVEVELKDEAKASTIWLPLPMNAGDHQRHLQTSWTASPGADVTMEEDPTYSARMVRAEWKGAGPRKIIVRSRIATQDRVALRPGRSLESMPAEAALYLQPTRTMPKDGIVAQTAQKITVSTRDPAGKTRAIYDWVVDNSFRRASTRGCGLGDIKFMLESGDLGGKCADINSLFVGLCRAAGVPAREVFGVRVADSRQFKSLGKSGDITRAQHCRAEVWLPGAGWFPADPADVRKAVLEENLPLEAQPIRDLRERLFGAWEMNWMGYNLARDFELPGDATKDTTNFFMYPEGSIGSAKLDPLDPDAFRYRTTSRELTA